VASKLTTVAMRARMPAIFARREFARKVKTPERGRQASVGALSRRLGDRGEAGEGLAGLWQLREADEVGDAGEGAPERLDLGVGAGSL